MQALMTLILVPLIILNLAGWLVSGIWLAMLGEWSVIGVGIFYMVASPLALSLALMPGLIFAAPGAALMDRGHFFFGGLIALPSLVWTYLVLGASCVLVVAYTTAAWDGRPMLPYVLWAYAVAVTPWSFLAQKDAQAGQNEAGWPLFFAQLATVAMGVATLFYQGPMYWMDLVVWCAPFMGVGLLLQLIMVVGAAIEERRMTPLERMMRSVRD